jgi:uncharacterized protein (TIGR00369 family)
MLDWPAGGRTVFEPRNPRFADEVRASFARQRFMGFLGAELVEVQVGFCEIRLPYRPELAQQHGYFHAGVISTICDNVCGYAAYSLTPPDCSILTVEYKLNLLAPGDGELLIGRGSVIKGGRTLTVSRANAFIVRDGREQLCATALATLMLLPGRPDRPADSG